MIDRNHFISELSFVILAFLIFILGVKLIKWLFIDNNSKLHDRMYHSWTNEFYIGTNAQFCSVCEVLVPFDGGAYCDACGIYVHPKCCKKATILLCKAVTLPTNLPMYHQWIRGPVDSDSVCDVCDEPCDCKNDEMFTVEKCCWCFRTVHVTCKPNIAEVCDLGPYKNYIIPPNCIEILKLKNRFRRKLIMKSIATPTEPDWSPIFLLANSKSGSNDGQVAISKFRGLFNPAQVVDLSTKRPDAALEWLKLLPDANIKIIVAGGDGTVSWILNTIQSMKISKIPAIAILPLGTGNDLSRVLGWGPGMQASKIHPDQFLNWIQKSENVFLDRWNVRINSLGRQMSLKPSTRDIFMYNYVGFGVDAQVALSFHKTRQSRFYLFNSRLFNKMLYVCFGTAQVIEQSCQGLQDRLDLYLDGKKVDLPAIEGIVILNIDSFGAGVKLWSMAKQSNFEAPASFSDRKLEIVAFFSSFHMGGLQMGVGVPYRIGQAKLVRVVLHSRVPVQVDGEPWEQMPAEFSIRHVNQAVMLKKQMTPVCSPGAVPL